MKFIYLANSPPSQPLHYIHIRPLSHCYRFYFSFFFFFIFVRCIEWNYFISNSTTNGKIFLFATAKYTNRKYVSNKNRFEFCCLLCCLGEFCARIRFAFASASVEYIFLGALLSLRIIIMVRLLVNTQPLCVFTLLRFNRRRHRCCSCYCCCCYYRSD